MGEKNHVDKIGRLVVDGMMLALLWAIIALPLSTFSLVRLENTTDDSNVLSGEDVRNAEDVRPAPQDETKDFRELEEEEENADEDQVQYYVVLD